MRMFVVTLVVLGALGFGLYQCKPIRMHVRNVLVGVPEAAQDDATAAAAQQSAAEEEEAAADVDVDAGS
jgi:hypothetical protein